MPKSANALVVMAKAPLVGEVKTRLAPPLSLKEAAELYRCLLLDLLENVRSFEGADLYVAFSPAAAAALFHEITPRDFVCFPQRRGDLGERMASIFEDLFEKSYERAVVIGSGSSGDAGSTLSGRSGTLTFAWLVRCRYGRGP